MNQTKDIPFVENLLVGERSAVRTTEELDSLVERDEEISNNTKAQV